MARPNPKRVVTAHRSKTAGEVRFIKDRGSDKNEWGWGTPGPSERQIQQDFVFQPKYLKPLAQTLRSCLMALGHATSAHARFVKIKSRNVSPDGSLGGQGYIAKIPEMRRQLMNVVEALSSITDTVYDEIKAPHWDPAEDTLDPRDRDEVKEIVEDAEEIREDPEEWAEEQEEALDEEGSKKASARRVARRVTRRYAYRDEAPSWGTPTSWTMAPKAFPEFWKAMNDIQSHIIQIQAQARKIGYWSTKSQEDLRDGALELDEIEEMTARARDLTRALEGPLRDLDKLARKHRVASEPDFTPFAASRERLRLATLGIEPMITNARIVHNEIQREAQARDLSPEVDDLSYEVADLVGDLRAARQNLRQILETVNG